MTETNGTREGEHIRQPMELNQMISRNRLRLAFILGAFTLLAMGVSGLGIYAIHKILSLSWNYWLVLMLFWCAYVIYVVLRFILGWRWMFRLFAVEPAGPDDVRLQVALDAACIAAGLLGQVRLMVMPNDDVNSFSLAPPDGSYIVMVTRGAANKLPERAREGMLAHEIGHIQAGDTLLQTIYLCLLGRSGFPRRLSEGGSWSKGRSRRNASFILGVTIFYTLFLISVHFLRPRPGLADTIMSISLK